MSDDKKHPEREREFTSAKLQEAEVDDDDMEEVTGGADVPFANMPIY